MHKGPMKRNLYDLLGVSPLATRNEIKSQYYKLSKLYHPDTSESDKSASWRNEKFVQINEAYSVLQNDLLRCQYDKQCGFEALQKRPTYYGINNKTEQFRTPGYFHRSFEHESCSGFNYQPGGSKSEWRGNLKTDSVDKMYRDQQKKWDKLAGIKKDNKEKKDYEQSYREEQLMNRKRLLAVTIGVASYFIFFR